MKAAIRPLFFVFLLGQIVLLSCREKLEPGPAPVAAVSVEADAATMVVGQNLQLRAVLKDAAGNVLNGRPIVWSVDNGALATVSASGLLTALLPGTVQVWASSEQQSGTLRVVITKVPVASISLPPDTVRLREGATAQLRATLKDATGAVLTDREVVWTSADTTKARVSPAGLVTALTGSAEPVFIRATCEGKTAEMRVRLDAPDVRVSILPGVLELAQQTSTSFEIDIRSLFGYSGPVTLQFRDLPTNVTIEPYANPLTVPANGNAKGMAAIKARVTGVVTLKAFSLVARTASFEKTFSLPLNILPQTPPRVRLIYLIPTDKEPSETVIRGIERAAYHLQIWYHRALGNGRTFAIGDRVEVVRMVHPSDWFVNNIVGNWTYSFWNNVTTEGFRYTGGRYNDPQNVWVYYIDADNGKDQIGGAAASGVVVLSGYDVRGVSGGRGFFDWEGICRYTGGLGHEIGHAFGLPHPAGCDQNQSGCDWNALLWTGYANYPNTYLTVFDKDILNRSPFFQTRAVAPNYVDCSTMDSYVPSGRRAAPGSSPVTPPLSPLDNRVPILP
ncbi:Ig-like domain-containing protein [Tellurirhabdus rosea]|uniref:Ig-like domain-containing protein n=1 Tax=Tellurirhabdus rosea TaxID=2674997 RepID=UPI00225117E2|nr:Ig-like domain-containing protein [Tellurirhabdus rosea]